MYLLLGHWGPYLTELPVLKEKKNSCNVNNKDMNKKIPTDSM